MIQTRRMMVKINNRKTVFFFGLFLFGIISQSCDQRPIPRPYGYFRVDLPTHDYNRMYILGFPYSFDISTSSKIVIPKNAVEKYWMDIEYPSLHATIYCSYKPVKSNLFDLLEDARKIVYKHTVRADGIIEVPFENTENRVFGTLYELSGNAASPMQFVLTDSLSHFFRAALYFENVPNKDSIAPIAQYIEKDIVKLIESFKWEK